MSSEYLRIREVVADALPSADADDIAKSLASSGVRLDDLFNPCFMN